MTTETKTCALVVSRDPDLKTILQEFVNNESLDWISCDSLESAADILRNETVSLVYCDRQIFANSTETLQRIIRRQSPIPEVIVVGAPAEFEETFSVAADASISILAIPVSAASAVTTTGRALSQYRLRREIGTLRSHVAMTYGYDNIVGESPALRSAKETAARIAPTDISTLLTGPAGSGKGLFARTIHQHSERRRSRFVMVDCSAVSSDQIKSELFGSTDSSAASLCEQADGGTIFIDEVGVLDASAQQRLMTFLKDGMVTRGGGSGTKKVDVRLIASTSSNLHSLVASGEFREDLYFKLAVITLAIPALADRMEDVPLLADYYLRRLSRELMRPDMTLTTLAIEKLMSHRWPGNVRELENALRRAAALTTDGQIDTAHVSFLTTSDDSAISEPTREGRHSLTISSGLLVHHQREVIVRALDDNRWNFTKTAAALGIGRTTLWRKVKKYNLVPASGVVVEE